MAADILTNLITSLGVDFTSPITLAINVIVSTIIGGIVLLVLVEIVGKKFSEEVHPANAFLVVLIINIINLPIVMAFIGPMISFIPFLPVVLPILIWIVMIKLFFKEMSFLHAIIVGGIGWGLSIVLVPLLVGVASGFIPSFV
ncbi:MAG: hypothetical protein JSV39_04020 [Candidatus Aenigmatarchaeota archaeon]|nr:MAG: hypothetical protein JSV39_04020 [Candidatus Aenigmarchaeota archaeon]